MFSLRAECFPYGTKCSIRNAECFLLRPKCFYSVQIFVFKGIWALHSYWGPFHSYIEIYAPVFTEIKKLQFSVFVFVYSLSEPGSIMPKPLLGQPILVIIENLCPKSREHRYTLKAA